MGGVHDLVAQIPRRGGGLYLGEGSLFGGGVFCLVGLLFHVSCSHCSPLVRLRPTLSEVAPILF